MGFLAGEMFRLPNGDQATVALTPNWTPLPFKYLPLLGVGNSKAMPGEKGKGTSVKFGLEWKCPLPNKPRLAGCPVDWAM
ncbi:uncharacterized protein PGTG_20850 [Puccinia graminis f. sp. tritici CRL 75-36-700-3]|uniref:Uncharacterized protein n=1 Tax=Puccinia graminis f. sp. tritici (strain CRL 75-36-700-3 / race SCCL) TaxID=418459 RepID=H6QPI3_PUCGT|nr:uncharacterized protein PGTG_20850 [Puccinia graminis f. sp. tritici CRL 75-36-700-3]EHS63868.1 hypothetical protein PGTG_20850 [Puccinia graminis f. sp. tritici CRL 75-36-700-3]